ncbi:MAG: MHYT domain-containing protein [Rhodomicrobiaceae bacterium]
MIVSYDPTLVLLSISVAILGSFAGFLIMARRGVFTSAPYKLKIVAGAATIGSSIWSMHFIAMLALGLPVPVDYDSLVTTISAFIAILLTGLGLYAASSGRISRYSVPAGGLLMGSGIAGMHYMGMSAIRANCIVSYDPFGVAASILVGIAVSTLALWFTFRERGPWETVGGAVALGLAISSMHYVAMMATSFASAGDIVIVQGPVLTQHNLAFIVAITTFLICGLFLVIALPDQKRGDDRPRDISVPAAADAEAGAGHPLSIAAANRPARIPLRRNQSVFFAEPASILAVRADGHYSWISLKSDGGTIDEFFCERSISVLAKLLAAPQFVRSHRSHLVNIEHVLGFRRQGDGGLLLLSATGECSVPVSRSNVRQVLTLLEGRPGHLPPLPQAAPA